MQTKNIRTKQRVASALKAYAKKMEDWVHTITKVKKLRSSAANSFLLAVMFDRNIDADMAWKAGEWINDSLGEPNDPSALWKALVRMERKRLLGFLRYGYTKVRHFTDITEPSQINFLKQQNIS
ncbi:MAG: hypothetical protein ACUVUQ_04700 [Thermodesulfovibrionales bacterium]